MTTSNGEGSGYVVPGTGVMLNNMLGEEDLHPHGFHQWNTNERISSMMSPSVLVKSDGGKIALGSGGSNRIRTAILQVLINIIDFGMSTEKAVDYPRIHFERGKLDIEPGFEQNAVDQLRKEFDKLNLHDSKGVFFGGTHVAELDREGNYRGAGDVRRGGVVKCVD
jgi:gamma-glutamyltranspeptidase/glutathione hydrolase